MSRVQKGDLCMICRIPKNRPGYEHNGKYITATTINQEFTSTNEGRRFWNYDPPLFCDWADSYYVAIAEENLEPIKKFPVDELIETKEPAHV